MKFSPKKVFPFLTCLNFGLTAQLGWAITNGNFKYFSIRFLGSTVILFILYWILKKVLNSKFKRLVDSCPLLLNYNFPFLLSGSLYGFLLPLLWHKLLFLGGYFLAVSFILSRLNKTSFKGILNSQKLTILHWRETLFSKEIPTIIFIGVALTMINNWTFS